MNRKEFSKLINDAAARLDTPLIVVGSGAILGTLSDKSLTEPMKLSREIDFLVKNQKEYDLITGIWTQGSHYEKTFNLHMDPLTLNTLHTTPSNWLNRLVPYKTNQGTLALCMHPADLFVTKLLAGRPKDIAFTETQAKLKLVAKTDIKYDGLSNDNISKVKTAIKQYKIGKGFSPATTIMLDREHLKQLKAFSKKTKEEDKILHKLYAKQLATRKPLCLKTTTHGTPCANFKKTCPHHKQKILK